MTFMEHIMPAVSRPTLTRTPPLRLVRYALSGALVGVAAAGVVAWAFGIPQHDIHDLIGAGAGFSIVLLIKALHLA
jgi:phosphate/sulfate permease